MPTSKSDFCALCGTSYQLESHHVLGRIGENKNKPYNLITLCLRCHSRWHTSRSDEMEDIIYLHMKREHGDQFPMWYHGRPYYTKWLIKAEQRMKPKEDEK